MAELDKDTKGNETRRDPHKIDIDTPDPGYTPFPVSILDRSTYEALTFDPTLGKPATISYSLTKDGWIRIRLVRRDQKDLLIRTLLDWTLQGFGRHEVKWDGRDASGNIVDNKKILVLFDAKDQGKGKLHQEHNEERCFDPRLKIERIESGDDAKGIVKLRVTLLDKSGDYDEVGYEVRYYIDYSLVQKVRYQGDQTQFDFQLNTASLKTGEHMITVNVDDLHDHVGTASLRLNV